MANKSRLRQARRKPRSGHPADDPEHDTKQVPSVAALQGAWELGALVPAFVRWHREHGETQDPAIVLEHLTAFLCVHATVSGDSALTALEPKLMAELVALLIELDPEIALHVCTTLFQFMHFLRDTGRWSGTPESYQAVRRVLFDGMFNEKCLMAFGQRKRASRSLLASSNTA